MSGMVLKIEDAMARAQAAAATPKGQGRAAAEPKGNLLVPVENWLKDVSAPQWVVEGIVQQGYLYAVTAITNHGKTAITLLLGMCVASGRKFCGKDIRKGGVLILCGENPDGFRTRLRATLAAMELDETAIAGRAVVLHQALPLRMYLDDIKAEAKALGIEYNLVLVDTHASYFTGDDEDSNIQARDAAMDLRELTELPGRPAVLANCHPTKSATHDSLLPRGGGAFLNEIDANLTVWAEGETAVLHWQRKKRGPDFDPLPFEFHGTNVDEAGVQVPTVVAWPISEVRAVELKRERRERENRILRALYDAPTGTIRQWVAACGWDPAKNISRVMRGLEKLKEAGLVEWHRGDYALTARGKKEAAEIN